MTPRRELVFEEISTGARDTYIDVTDHSERTIEKVERGMIRNMSDEWFVNDIICFRIEVSVRSDAHFAEIEKWISDNCSERPRRVSKGASYPMELTLRFMDENNAMLTKMKWG